MAAGVHELTELFGRFDVRLDGPRAEICGPQTWRCQLAKRKCRPTKVGMLIALGHDESFAVGALC